MLTPRERAALTEIAAAAVESERSSGVPAELTAAQCILESGWLAHSPLNNCFGIKEYPGCFGTQLLPTEEWFTETQANQFLALGNGRAAKLHEPLETNGDKRLYDVLDLFATFPSLSACFAYHDLLLTSLPVYSPAWAAWKIFHDLPRLIDDIGPIYATSPDYASTIKSLAFSPALAEALRLARLLPPTVSSTS